MLQEGNQEKLKALLEELEHRTRSRNKLDPLEARIRASLNGTDCTISVETNLSKQKPRQPIRSETPGTKQETLHNSSGNSKKTSKTTAAPLQAEADRKKYPLPEKKEVGVHRIRACSPDLTGVPGPWAKELEEGSVNELKPQELDALPWAHKFVHALTQWISDRKKSSATFIPFQAGQKIRGMTGESSSCAYAFNVPTRADELFDGASVVVRVGNKRYDGRIISIAAGSTSQVAISIDEDLGEKLEGGQISVDDTAMSIYIRDLLAKECGLEKKNNDEKESLKKGLSLELASRVLENSFSRLPQSDYSHNHEGLNNAQSLFVQKALSHDISLLWGPPGTGKTQTLTAVIKSFCDAGERTLICSNTNMAVDQVFLKCCKERNNKFIASHKMVRVGNISHRDLIQDFAGQITVDGISERLGKALQSEINSLVTSKEVLIQKNQTLLAQSEKFEKADLLTNDIERAEVEFDQTKAAAKALRDQVASVESSIAELQHKLIERSSGRGGLGGILGRSPSTLQAEIDTLSTSRDKKSEALDNYRAKLERIQRNGQKLIDTRRNLLEDIKGVDRSRITSEAAEIKKDLRDIDKRCMELEESLRALRKTIIDNALVVGTTLAKACMSISELGFYDNVIIDEASMASLPMLFIASSMSKKRVVISGDFAQLSPICETNNQSVKNILGKSVFDICGIEDSVRSGGRTADNLAFLDTQYRMSEGICNLISGFMYEGKLSTGSTTKRSLSILHPRLDQIGELVLLDTSPLLPFSSATSGKSKVNLLHAYIARKFLLDVSEANDLSLGYCTPFAAQSKLFSSLLTEKDKERITSIGTVHKFQGDERDLLVYDTVAAQSESNFLAPFLNSSSPREEGAKNLNVAISRAKQSLVVIADLRILDSQLGKYSFLRDVLFKIQEQGRVFDARDLVLPEEIGNFESEFRSANISIAKSSLSEGMVHESSFFPLLYKSFEEAKEAIIIFSGFFTPSRVSEVLSILDKPIKRGVKVKFVVPSNQTNGTFGKQDPAASAALVSLIRSKGVVVEQRKSLHQKAVLIDEDICWLGSLNPLSFAGSTLESMFLVRQAGFALGVANELSLPGAPTRSSIRDCAESETPRCAKCGASTVFTKGKFGIYFPCEISSCDGKGNHRYKRS